MLGLYDDVDGGTVNRRALVCDHHDLRGAGEGGWDAHDGTNLLFGQRDIATPGPDDDVDRLDRLRPVRHGGDCLRSSYAIELVDSGQVCCRQDFVGYAPVGPGRNTDDHGADTRHLRRNRRHQHARGISSPPARDIDAGPCHGKLQVLDGNAVAFVHAGLDDAPAVERLDAV